MRTTRKTGRKSERRGRKSDDSERNVLVLCVMHSFGARTRDVMFFMCSLLLTSRIRRRRRPDDALMIGAGAGMIRAVGLHARLVAIDDELANPAPHHGFAALTLAARRARLEFKTVERVRAIQEGGKLPANDIICEYNRHKFRILPVTLAEKPNRHPLAPIVFRCAPQRRVLGERDRHKPREDDESNRCGNKPRTVPSYWDLFESAPSHAAASDDVQGVM